MWPASSVLQGSFIQLSSLRANLSGQSGLLRAPNAYFLPGGIDLPRHPSFSLDQPLQARLQDFFRSDFSKVRFYTSLQAKTLGARSFTAGDAVVFAPGFFATATTHGRRLIAHELSHVIQQRAGRVQNPFRQGTAIVVDPGLEAEAEARSLGFLRHLDSSWIGYTTGRAFPVSAARAKHGLGRSVVQLASKSEKDSKSPAPAKDAKDQKAPKKRKPRENYSLGGNAVMAPAGGHSGAGYLPAATQLVIRQERKYATPLERIEQALGQISTQLYFMTKATAVNPIEVETMFAAGNTFLAANTRAGANAIYKSLLHSKRNVFWSKLIEAYGRGKDLKISSRHGRKLAALKEGKRDAGAKEVVDALQGELCYIDLDSGEAADQAGIALTTFATKMTFVVFGLDSRHAEVKLVKVLQAAGYKGSAVIQGKKRPCYTCAAYMRLRKLEGYQLHFSDKPGKFWKDEFLRSEADVQEEVAAAIESDVRSHRTAFGEAYRSESESDDDRSSPRQAPKRRSVAIPANTASSSMPNVGNSSAATTSSSASISPPSVASGSKASDSKASSPLVAASGSKASSSPPVAASGSKASGSQASKAATEDESLTGRPSHSSAPKGGKKKKK